MRRPAAGPYKESCHAGVFVSNRFGAAFSRRRRQSRKGQPFFHRRLWLHHAAYRPCHHPHHHHRGQIEGHTAQNSSTKTTKYEHIIPQLAAIEQSPNIDGLLILLNTVGGDVEAGLAIAEVIASMTKPTVSLVLGGGHSIGVPLTVSARKSSLCPPQP